MNRLSRIGLTAALAASCAIAAVQAATVAGSEAEAAKAIEARQDLFKQIKDLNDPIGKMLRRQAPLDTTVVATNAAKIQELAARIPGAFTVDTHDFKGTKTAALDGIWNSEADFKTKADALVSAAADAVAAAKSGDEAATQKSLIGIGKGCGGCHDAFKASTK